MSMFAASPRRRARLAALLALPIVVALMLSGLSLSRAYDGDGDEKGKLIAPAHDAAASDPTTLRAQVSQRGRLRVIATLNVNYRPEGQLAGAEATAQRATIRATTARVLSRLAGADYTVNATFEVYPFLGVTVDPIALEALLTSPDILSVVESTLKRPMDLQSNRIIGADVAHNLGYTGSGHAIVVLDTGVQTSHPFLAGKTIAEACFSRTDASAGSTTLCPNGQSTTAGGSPGQAGPGAGVNCTISIDGCDHGTHVAGIAVGRNYSGGPGYNGVAPDATLIAIQVFSRFNSPAFCNPFPTPCISAFDEDILAALQYVQTTLAPSYTIAAVNMSLGDSSNNTAPCDSSPYFTAVAGLRSLNIATVIAAGNNGYPNGLSSPACVSNAISVGSTTKQDSISSFSNRAGYMSLFAPGSSINSSVPNNSYATFNGTSMAAPHVAGAWAVMRQRYPGEGVGQILTRLQTTGKPITFGSNTRSRIQLEVAAGLPTATPTNTPPPPTATSTPHPNTNYMIQDGSFEGGVLSAHWVQYSARFGSPLCTLGTCGGVGPRTGTWWAWFGGTTQAEQGFLQQRKRIAPGVKALTFWMWWSAGHHVTSTFKISMDGKEIFSLNGATNAAYRSGWTPVAIDISAYADDNVHTLRFEQSNQAGELTNIHLDDVSVSGASPSAPTPTATPETPTLPTATPTPTPTGTPPTPTATPGSSLGRKTFLPITLR
ncbi:MAG: S8 family serine peptidase [Candidatus Brachytrichaceae bacterium NZ_4S206]